MSQPNQSTTGAWNCPICGQIVWMGTPHVRWPANHCHPPQPDYNALLTRIAATLELILDRPPLR